MALQIFSDVAGTVKKITAPENSVPGLLTLDLLENEQIDNRGNSLNRVSLSSFVIITGYNLNAKPNYSITPALTGPVFLYTFGDKPTLVRVRGLIFAKSCEPNVAATDTGVTNFLKFYNQNKISSRILTDTGTGVTRSDIPRITITIGNTPLSGYLVGTSMSSSDPVTLMSQFMIEILILPKQLDRQFS